MTFFKVLPHQADFKIKVWAKDQQTLFKNAFLALTKIIKPGKKFELKKEIKFSLKLKSKNTSLLLIDFLNEILAQSQIKKAVFDKINFQKLTEFELEAQILGRKIKKFKRDIKAVTYYQAQIKKSKNKFEIEIVFDI